MPSARLCRAGRVLRTVLLSRAPHMIRDRRYRLRTYRRCLVGAELVDWLVQLLHPPAGGATGGGGAGAGGTGTAHVRHQAVAMAQALLEEGVLVHGESRPGACFVTLAVKT